MPKGIIWDPGGGKDVSDYNARGPLRPLRAWRLGESFSSLNSLFSGIKKVNAVALLRAPCLRERLFTVLEFPR